MFAENRYYGKTILRCMCDRCHTKHHTAVVAYNNLQYCIWCSWARVIRDY